MTCVWNISIILLVPVAVVIMIAITILTIVTSIIVVTSHHHHHPRPAWQVICSLKATVLRSCTAKNSEYARLNICGVR